VTDKQSGITVCYYKDNDKDFKLHSDRPQTAWFAGIAFDLVEWSVYPPILLCAGLC